MKLKNLRPLNGQVFVIDDKVEEKTKSGIYLPDNKTPELIITGTVVAASDIREEGKTRPADVEKGDKVFYSFYAGAGSTFESDKGDLIRIVKHTEIVAKEVKEEKCSKKT